MKNAYEQDSLLWRILNTLADVMIMTLLWLVFCIPLVTIGASTAALYTCVFRYRRGEGVRFIREFWEAFRSNFKQATALWAIVVALLATAVADVWLIFFTAFEPGTIAKMMMLTAVFVILMVISYVFPLQAYFVNTVGRTMKNAALMALMYLPVSVVILVINLVPVAMWLLMPEIFTRTLFLWTALGGGGIAYICGGMFQRIFQRHEPEKEEETE